MLDPLAPELSAALDGGARAAARERRREAVAAVAAQDPRCLRAWADLAELADDPIERYAFARVGYHRGLDTLRAAGWRGSGYVRWRHESNRGFLRSLHALEQAAGRDRRGRRGAALPPLPAPARSGLAGHRRGGTGR